MKRTLRGAVLAISIAALVGAGPAAPAIAAPGAAAFTGTARINCFGCGTSTGTADLCVIVIILGGPPTSVCVTGVNATASYTVAEGTGVTCVITGSATGSVVGALNVTFTWLRVGAVAVITTAGDINGAGVAGFAVTSPAGIPCGGPVVASFAGAIAGT